MKAVPTTEGRLTMPIQTGMDDEVREILARLGADAVRNSDGTELPDLVHELATKVYSTYFVGRGDNPWVEQHPEARTRIYLMSERTPAPADGELDVPLMTGWFADQFAPDTECDLAKRWQCIDRTSGEVLDPADWELVDERTVRVRTARAGHVYTVNFLAVQQWDPTQMYNYITNGWESDPTREKEAPFDVRHDATWAHVKESLADWLESHPEVDVVRFTTFFYHFTLAYGPDAKERFVDWFGYSASVSEAALDAFEERMGYALTAEDFVDEGYYNSPFRPPRKAFRDWINFQHEFVTGRVRELVERVHAAGKEAMMFLGDNWIGTEPYGPHFASTGLDAVVGSVGSGATCRMIADIPGVRYTEGRFLPYFFPDVFRPGGDPVGEANESWVTARRAIVRHPLDRMGYGGYLSLALEHPDFVARVEEIVAEFRTLHERSAGELPSTAGIRVAVLNAWGKLRTWQTHMVAHALHYRQAYSYLGVVEALSGLPFDVEFIDFDDVLGGALDRVDVLVNVGQIGTAFSGGDAWLDADLVAAVNGFVARGGGFIGVGDPSAVARQGRTFQLADILGVDRELGWGLSTNRPLPMVEDHFITADLPPPFDVGEGTSDVVVVDGATEVLRAHDAQVLASAHAFGAGRGVYFAGLPYSLANSRLLHRAIHWAAGREADWGVWTAEDPRVEVAHYERGGQLLVFNNADEAVSTTVGGPDGHAWTVDVPAMAYAWLDITTL